MPPETADYVTTWAFLEKGVDDIMTGHNMSYVRYMSLYDVYYKICISETFSSSSERSVIWRCLSLFTSRLPAASR